MEIAIGFKNCACLLFSKSSGANPAIVVKEVKKIALNLDFPASLSASSKTIPDLKFRLNLPIKTNPSFTIIPIKAIIPSNDNTFNGNPKKKCPQATAVKLKGINRINNNGCE